jgi:hypothetical protein
MLVFCETVFDRHIAAVDITGFTQAATERGREIGPVILTERVQEPDNRHRPLLRARRKRPRRRRAAEEGDELATPHSITSSARASSVGGTSRPSAFAVLRLIKSSNFVGCSTGSSLGLVPFNILST